MSHSFATTANLNCIRCHQPFTSELWLIVDADERVDLFEHIRAGTLHELACPHCETVNHINAPVLILHSTQKPSLIFVPADGASDEQNKHTADQLIALLRQNMADDWKKIWVNESETLQWDSMKQVPVDQNNRSTSKGTPSLSPSLQALLSEIAQLTRITDMPRLAQLCEAALTQIDRRQNPALWAALQNDLGNSLQQSLQGLQAENLERAIALYEQALQVRIRQAMPIEWALTTYNLANAYKNRIQGERAENLERAIALYEQALEVQTRQAMPIEWAATIHNLALAYVSRIRGERAENLERAIELIEQTLQVSTRQTMPIEWAQATMNLASAYGNRIRGERAENLERAIELIEQTLQVSTRQTMPIEWAQATMNLALAYASRIRGERAENLERAIELGEQTLQVLTRQAMPIEWAAMTHNLALVYMYRIRGERAENLERAIDLYEQALRVRTRQAMPIDWAQTTMSMMGVYMHRIRGERAENLERAIALGEQALQISTRQAMPIEWAQTTMNLAGVYTHRIRGERAENLERAIALSEQALQVLTRQAMPIEWAQTTTNLALAYTHRIRGERAENLERAIALGEQALQVSTRQAMPIEWAQTIMDLAGVYVHRIRGERAENLERAIALYEQALQVLTRQAMPIEWAQATMNLAGAYGNRIRGERAENLERAIALSEQALQVRTRQAMPIEWALTTYNLARAYASRIRGERAENLERAIALGEQALQVLTRQAMPIEWAQATMNLALAYTHRIRGERAENLERAIALNEQALQVRTRQAMPIDWAQTIMDLAGVYVHRIRGERAENLKRAIALSEQVLTVYTLNALPDDHRRTQSNLGYLYLQQGRWSLASTAYRAALQASGTLYQTAAIPEARQRELTKLQGVPALYTYALLKTKVDSAFCQQAVVVLEENRARWLSESLALRIEKPAGVADSLWQGFVDLGKQIQALQAESRLSEDTPAKRSFPVLSELLRSSYEQLTEIVAKIRATSPNFMPQLSFAEIQAAAHESLLVYLLTTTQGGLALIVDPDEIIAVWLDQLTEATLDRHLVQRDADGNTTSGYLVGQLTNLTSLRATLPDLLRWLGETAMSPLATILRQRLMDTRQEGNGKPSITLIPGGRLSLLPLHAATYLVDGKTVSFLDEYDVHFAPSARSLIHARNIRAQRQHQPTVLLGVGNPLPVTIAPGEASWRSLPNAEIEVEEIAEQLRHETVYRFYKQAATRASVLPHLSTATLLHLSCHGLFNPDAALDSGLQLADGMLTLRELLDSEFHRLDHLRLAVLSACQTAITDFRDLPDESIGLPAGFLQAGAPGIVGSLWPVEDQATALLMRRFYQNFLNKKLEPVAALGEAQRWLRNLTWQELGDYYRSFISRMSANTALQMYDQSVRPKLKQDPKGRPYENPYYWAGFTFTGV